MIRITLCLFILLFTSTVGAKAELKGHPDELKSFIHPDKKIVTIRMTEKEKAYSDKAIVSLVITTEKKNLAGALQLNSDLRVKIAEVLTSSGLKPKNIKTSKFSTSPQFGWFSDKPKSYQVVNRMAISITDEKQLNTIAKLSDENKEIAFSGTEFEHTLKSEVEQKLKNKTLAKIMTQKAFYETQLGLKLKAISFSDTDVVQSGTKGARDLERRVVITGSRVKRDSYDSDAPIAVKQTFDEVEYSLTIAVQFEVLNSEQTP